MYRRLAVLFVAAISSGCGLGSQNVSSGFADLGTSPAAYTGPGPLTLASDNPLPPGPAGVAPAAAANVADKAPSGSFETASKGALSGRDFTNVVLNPETARDLINQYRRAKGLKPLTLNVELTKAAKAHARDLARWDRISHFGSDGSNPMDRVVRTGYDARLAAENVGTGQASFEEVLKGWKESPGHNKNLLMRDANHMGVALVHDPKTEFKSFWTLVLASAM